MSWRRALAIEVLWLLLAGLAAAVLSTLLFGWEWMHLGPWDFYTPYSIYDVAPTQSASMLFFTGVFVRYAILLGRSAWRAGGTTAVRVLVPAICASILFLHPALEGVEFLGYLSDGAELGETHPPWLDTHFVVTSVLWFVLNAAPVGVALCAALALFRQRGANNVTCVPAVPASPGAAPGSRANP